MSFTDLNSFQRLNGQPCVAATPSYVSSGPGSSPGYGGNQYLTYNSIQPLLMEFAKLKQLLVNAENGLNPGFPASTAAPIGSVMMWALGPGAVPAGWAIMDGTANAAGSGIDMRGRFPRGIATAPSGVGGGSATTSYTPTGNVTLTLTGGLSSATITFDTNVDVTIGASDLTGTVNIPFDVDIDDIASALTIAGHPNHYHIFGLDVISYEGGGNTAYVADAATVFASGGSFAQYTGEGDDDADTGTSPSAAFLQHDTPTGTGTASVTADFDLSEWDHTHPDAYIAASTSFDCSITGDIDGTATFTGDADDIAIDPPYMELIFIERIS